MFAAVWPAISPQAVDCFFALAIGFAFAGSCANGYRLFGEHFPSFRLLESGPAAARFAAIPLLVFAAPFIIMRNSVRGRRIERRRAQMVMLATVIAGLWRLMSGTVVVMAFEAVIGAGQTTNDRLSELRLWRPSSVYRSLNLTSPTRSQVRPVLPARRRRAPGRRSRRRPGD
jgi:hypothetical protein